MSSMEDVSESPEPMFVSSGCWVGVDGAGVDGSAGELELELNEVSSCPVAIVGSLLAAARAQAEKCAMDLYMSLAGRVKLKAVRQAVRNE